MDTKVIFLYLATTAPELNPFKNAMGRKIAQQDALCCANWAFQYGVRTFVAQPAYSLLHIQAVSAGLATLMGN